MLKANYDIQAQLKFIIKNTRKPTTTYMDNRTRERTPKGENITKETELNNSIDALEMKAI